jgi:hypothetical protein
VKKKIERENLISVLFGRVFQVPFSLTAIARGTVH